MNARTILPVLGICFAVGAGAGTLSGPVTGGERGSPFAAVDVANRGYLTEEYFLEGKATAYELAEGTHAQDGRWKAWPAQGKADFKTRLLVVRPEDPAVFNGTVIVFWLNVTAGFELGSASAEALRGYAWVGQPPPGSMAPTVQPCSTKTASAASMDRERKDTRRSTSMVKRGSRR